MRRIRRVSKRCPRRQVVQSVAIKIAVDAAALHYHAASGIHSSQAGNAIAELPAVGVSLWRRIQWKVIGPRVCQICQDVNHLRIEPLAARISAIDQWDRSRRPINQHRRYGKRAGRSRCFTVGPRWVRRPVVTAGIIPPGDLIARLTGYTGYRNLPKSRIYHGNTARFVHMGAGCVGRTEDFILYLTHDTGRPPAGLGSCSASVYPR